MKKNKSCRTPLGQRGELSYVPHKPMNLLDPGPVPCPVRKITPPTTTEPAAPYTIAALLLRRNKARLDGTGELWGLYEITENRRLTMREAKRAIELLKGLA